MQKKRHRRLRIVREGENVQVNRTLLQIAQEAGVVEAEKLTPNESVMTIYRAVTEMLTREVRRASRRQTRWCSRCATRYSLHAMSAMGASGEVAEQCCAKVIAEVWGE